MIHHNELLTKYNSHRGTETDAAGSDSGAYGDEDDDNADDSGSQGYDDGHNSDGGEGGGGTWAIIGAK